jgi:hypothetical protein
MYNSSLPEKSWQEFSRTPIANLAGNPKLAGNPIANHMRSMPPEIGAILRSAAGRMIVTVNNGCHIARAG